jgi:HSP20 family protein
MQYHPHWEQRNQYRQEARKRWKQKFSNMGYPPANVEELNDHYLISIYAAGYQKSDFQVKVSDNILTVRVDIPKSEPDPFGYRGYRGFKPGNFRKEFELNEKVNIAEISAKYDAGILEITLPKLKGFETNQQEIAVA